MSKDWASSARFHHMFGEAKVESVDSVLVDYGLKPTGFPEDRTVVDVSEEIRRCKTCSKFLPLSGFSSQVKVRKGESKRYYNRECKACRAAHMANERREMAGTRKWYQQEVADAPIVAAVKLFEEHPEALALIIKHFRVPFTELYEAEKKAAKEREEARTAAMADRPQNFKSEEVDQRS